MGESLWGPCKIKRRECKNGERLKLNKRRGNLLKESLKGTQRLQAYE